MIEVVDFPGSQSIVPNKLFISRRTFAFSVTREHALNAHADTLDILHRAPALLAQEIEAYVAVGVDMGMNGNRSIGKVDKDDLRCLNRIGCAEFETQSESLVHVEWICIEDLDVHEPLVEAISICDGDSWWERSMDFSKLFTKPPLS